MASLKFEHIYKVYEGGVKAVSDLNLEIKDNEFVVFVGPSGCGKSTTLRMIAGLEEITSGNLYIDDKIVNDVSPKDRDITMVFQNYALYPHMTVYDNMAFGLKMAKVPKDEIKKRIENAAEILGLTPYLSRKPKALSGGQRQRVALGRSIVREPKVFLLDEPLSNLDAKLRVSMRSEITKLHRRLKTTFVYVTHDQTEAMTMGTIIVVMRNGVVQQVDTPSNLYDHPANVFVASFLGSPQMNLFNAKLLKEGNKYVGVINKNDSTFKVHIHDNTIHQLISYSYIGKDIILGIRPEEIFEVNEDDEDAVPVIIDVIEKLGSEIICYTQIENTDIPLVVKLDGRKEVKEGDKIFVQFHTRHVHLFDKDNERRISGISSENYIKSKIDYDKGVVSFANVNIKLNEEDKNKVLPEFRGSNDILIKIPTNAFKLEKGKDDDLILDAKIEIVEQSKEQSLLYVSLTHKKSYIAVKFNKGEYKEGEKIKLYIPLENITLYDENLKNRIVSRFEFTSNTTKCEVKKNKKGLNEIIFGNFKLIGDLSLNEGEYNLFIPYDAFTPVNKRKEINKHQCMKFKCVNEDSLGDNTLLYANLDCFEDYICIKAGKDDTCFKRNKQTFNIDLNKIIFTKI